MAVFFASWSVAALASLHSAAERASAGSFVQASRPMQPLLRETPLHRQAARAAAPIEKSTRLATLSTTQGKPGAVTAAHPPADPFALVIAEARLSREKLHAAFARAGMAIADAGTAEPVEVAVAMPIDARFHRPAPARSEVAPAADDLAAGPLSTAALGAIGLPAGIAYAATEATADSPIELALASLALDPYGVDEAEPDEAYPDTVEVPPARPDVEPAARREVARAPDPSRKPAKAESEEPQQELAYARPDRPLVEAFKGLFDTPKAGDKVAVYDISAAVVHMPDGTKLEAHSGIGKMADNPRYVHVRNRGPTPPNTYKLSLREKRFHGVEAIRMTPVGDQTMHGRDGMLAHSYLLRGGREESHGCVAFANYPKFLKAFKQGKITHMIVVPSMSKMPKVQMVSSRGRGA